MAGFGKRGAGGRMGTRADWAGSCPGELPENFFISFTSAVNRSLDAVNLSNAAVILLKSGEEMPPLWLALF